APAAVEGRARAPVVSPEGEGSSRLPRPPRAGGSFGGVRGHVPVRPIPRAVTNTNTTTTKTTELSGLVPGCSRAHTVHRAALQGGMTGHRVFARTPSLRTTEAQAERTDWMRTSRALTRATACAAAALLVGVAL